MESKRYRDLLDGIPHAIQECDASGVITFASRSNQEISGFTPEELVGTAIWERLVAAEDRERLREYLTYIVEAQPPPTPYHCTEQTKDGRRLELRVDWRYRRDGEGNPIGFISCLTDVTQQRDAERQQQRTKAELEQRVQERTEELQSIYDAMVDGVLIVDVLHDRVLRVNQAAERIMGYTMEELEVTPFSRVVPPARSQRVLEKLKALQEGTLKIAQSLPCIRKDGSEVRVDVTGGSIRYQGVPAAIFFLREEMDRDPYEDFLLEAEKSLPQLAANMRDVFWLCDRDANRVLYVSPSYEQTWGRSREELYANADAFCESVHPEDRKALWRHLRGSEKRSGSHQRFRILRPDGSVRWIHNRSFPIRDASGHAFRAIRISEDVTEVVESERAMHRSERLASLGTLAAGIAHEINNPIGAALIAAQTAIAVHDDPNAKQVVVDCLRNVVEAMDRCGRIVRNILRLARDEPRERSLECLSEIIRHAVDMSRESARKRGVTILESLDPSSPKLLLNAMEIELVLLNLIRNATEAKGANIWIRTEESARHVRVVVEDDGEGLDDERRTRGFDPFYTSRLDEGGTGLGLSIAHRIVADHLGNITLEPRSPKGARAVVEFPKAEASARTGQVFVE